MKRIFLCAAGLFLLCGCFDYNELNMQELVSGAAVDKEQGEIKVNIRCAPDSDSEEAEGAIYSGRGKSFFDAVRDTAGKSGKKLYWGHTQCIIIGEDAIDSTEEIIDSILRARDIHPDIVPVIAKGAKGRDIIYSEPSAGRDAIENISLSFSNEKNSRRFKARRIWQLMRDIEESGICILPVVELSGKEPELSGGAVMKKEKFAEYLSGEQILLLSMMTENGAGGYLPPVELSGERQVSFEILANDIKKKETEKLVEIEHKIVLSPSEVRGDVSDEEMKKAAEGYLKEGFRVLISFAKRKELGDIFATDGKGIDIKSEVRISNILGGKE